MKLSLKLEEANEVLQYLPSFFRIHKRAYMSFANYLVRTGSEAQHGNDVELVTNSIELRSKADFKYLISEAQSVWERKLAALLESDTIGEDADPYFDTDHIESVSRLGVNTYSNKAGLVKLSDEGIKHVVDMLKSLSDNKVTHIAIVVPTLEMFEYTYKILKSLSSVIDSCKVKCSVTFNPYLKDKKNWYVFNTSKKSYVPHIVIQEPLSFESVISVTENDVRTRIAYKTKGYVRLGPARNVIRATHF